MSAIPLPWQSDVWDGLNRRMEQGPHGPRTVN